MALPKKAKYTSDELSLARAAGFKRKRPTQPKGKLTEDKVRRYLERHNAWVKDLKRKAAERRKHIAARRKGGKTRSERLRDAMKG